VPWQGLSTAWCGWGAPGNKRGRQYKKRARNTVIFYVIAESIWQIKDLILYYYS